MNALAIYRLSGWFHRRGIKKISNFLNKFNYLIFSCYIPGSAKIGRSSVIAYGGIGVVIHARSEIGEGCVIGQGITLGTKAAIATSQDELVGDPPIVQDNVYIAAGSRLLGNITIGPNSVIGANSVVTKSFPAHSIVAGCPARVVGQTAPDYRAIIL